MCVCIYISITPSLTDGIASVQVTVQISSVLSKALILLQSIEDNG